MTHLKPICFDCKHFDINTSTCKAFSEEIPEQILTGDNDHTQPLTGQDNDIVFEPLQAPVSIHIRMTDVELKKASIINLTNDLNIIRVAMDDPELTLDRIRQLNDTGKMMSLFHFAEYTNDTNLVCRLEKIYKKELQKIYNE